MNRWLKRIREQTVGGKQELLRDAEAYHDALARESGAEAKLREVLRSFSSSKETRFRFGRMAETKELVEIPLHELIGVALSTMGGTGSGKSAANLALELSLFQKEMPASFWKIDGKGESAPWLTEDFLPAILSQWPSKDVDSFFGRYRVIDPFDPSNLPQLNVLHPIPGVPAPLQAKEVAVLLAETLGTGGVMGHRMTTVLTFAVRLALSIGGLSLLEVKTLLTNSNYLQGLLPNATDPEVREYFAYRFPKESKEALQAVISRLDLILLVPDTARVLCAPESIDIAATLEDGVAISNFGNLPHGAEYLGQFWFGFMFRALARAVMSRPVAPETKPLFACVDEWQVGLSEDLANHFERLLTLSRFKKVSWLLTNQLAGQIGSRYPQLLATLKNSAGIQMAFRQSHEDALALKHMLPKPKTQSRPGKQAGTMEDAIHEFARLPDRTFYFYWKKRGLEAVKLVSPTVNFAEAKRLADKAPKEIRDACQGKRHGLSRSALDRILEQRRVQIDAVANRMTSAGRPNFSRRAPTVNLSPDMSDREQFLELAAPDDLRPAEIESSPDEAFPFLG